LLQIAHAQRLNLPYVYLGYWVEGCRKMNYKTRFKPLETHRDGRWHGSNSEVTSTLSPIPLVNVYDGDSD